MTPRFHKLRCWLIAAALAISTAIVFQRGPAFVYAQNAPGATIWGLDANTLTAFDNAYWASLDTKLQGLRPQANQDTATRIALGRQLALSGELVDQEIMVYGSDPLCQMIARKNSGYAWWVNALQAVPGGPAGYSDPKEKPVGALLVSTNPADFPPFVDPNAVPPPPPSVIGPDLGFQMPCGSSTCEVFSSAAQQHFASGYALTTPAGTFDYTLLGDSLMSPTQRTGVWLKQ